MAPAAGRGEALLAPGDEADLSLVEPVVPDPVEHNDDPVAKVDQAVKYRRSQASQTGYPRKFMLAALATAALRPMVAMLPSSR